MASHARRTSTRRPLGDISNQDTLAPELPVGPDPKRMRGAVDPTLVSTFDPDLTQVDSPEPPSLMTAPPPLPPATGPLFSLDAAAGPAPAYFGGGLRELLNQRDQQLRAELAGALQRFAANTQQEIADLNREVARLRELLEEAERNRRSERDARVGGSGGSARQVRGNNTAAQLPDDDVAFRRALKAAITLSFPMCKAPESIDDYRAVVRRALAACRRSATLADIDINQALTDSVMSLINDGYRRARSRLSDRVREMVPALFLGEGATKADYRAAAWGPNGKHRTRATELLADLEGTAITVADAIFGRSEERPTEDDLMFIATIVHRFLNGLNDPDTDGNTGATATAPVTARFPGGPSATTAIIRQMARTAALIREQRQRLGDRRHNRDPSRGQRTPGGLGGLGNDADQPADMTEEEFIDYFRQRRNRGAPPAAPESTPSDLEESLAA